jgi:hypothetical protein
VVVTETLGFRLDDGGCQVGQPDAQINEKGARDYIAAARILSDHKGAPIGPILFCRGQAIEIALKWFLVRRSTFDAGAHEHHRLNDLHAACERTPNPLALKADQVRVINWLHPHHHRDAGLRQSSRYRPDRGRVVVSSGQDVVESLVETILVQAKE